MYSREKRRKTVESLVRIVPRLTDTIGKPGYPGGMILKGMVDGVSELRRRILRWSRSRAQVFGYIAREVYRALLTPVERKYAAGASLAARRRRLGLLQCEVATRL